MKAFIGFLWLLELVLWILKGCHVHISWNLALTPFFAGLGLWLAFRLLTLSIQTKELEYAKRAYLG